MKLTETKPNHYTFTYKEKYFKLRIWEKEKGDHLDPYLEFPYSASLERGEYRDDSHCTKDFLDVILTPSNIVSMAETLFKRHPECLPK